ncbi:hypothetical protein CP556_09855 [Natrinema sp. CBA1119]|uniref:hypothetical protein n=1 Tax=Natrinema sp. CBA1119 TaxID=1608465 RepID=UPI000BF7FEC5|nr:hypothetical protein [Natrinema sp. CBA1119]PGF16388.1 hypothetical protein CP556_09855 [Natrinema sp. CBA1119]
MPSAYCGECGWQHRVDGDDPGELSRAMIDHFVETGHSVERRDAEERGEPSSGTADRSLEPSQKKEQ